MEVTTHGLIPSRCTTSSDAGREEDGQEAAAAARAAAGDAPSSAELYFDNDI